MIYTDKQLIERIKQLPSFKTIPQEYYIIGLRNSKDTSNVFDDIFYLMLGDKIIFTTSGTTNPGLPILQKGYLKYNKAGAAIVEADKIYYDLWKPGMHLGKIPGLLQLGNKISVFRDGDNDSKAEELGKATEGYYGINFHADQYDINAVDKNSNLIGSWSAGCQVCNNMKEYKEFIKYCKPQKTVTYILLNEFSI